MVTVIEGRPIMIIPRTGLKLELLGTEEVRTPPSDVVFLSQVHGTTVVMEPAENQTADGMVIPRGRGFPGLRTADCLGVFAVWKSFTGAAHAGWKGLAGGIVERLLSSVQEPLEYLILGPCICADCYKVGEEVRRAVAKGDPAGMEGHPPGRVDIKGSAMRRARKTAGKEFRLLNIRSCTMETEHLYSYRRNGTTERNLLWLAETGSYLHIRH